MTLRELWSMLRGRKTNFRFANMSMTYDPDKSSARIARAMTAYPVAYRWRYDISEWGEWRWVYTDRKPDWSGAIYEPLYTTPAPLPQKLGEAP